MKKRSLWLLPLAGALALTGCSGSGDKAPASNESSTAASASAPAEAPAAKTLDAAQVKKVVESLVADESGAVVVDGDTIAAQLPAAKALVEQMKIEPEQCADLVAQQSSWDINGINMAVASLTDASTGESLSYTVASYEDAAKLEEIKKAAQNKDMKGCESFSMEMQGQKMEANAEILDVSSDAELTYATKTEISLAGTEVPMGSLTVQGIVGNNAVSVASSGGTEDQQTQIDALVKELNVALAELAKVQ